MKKVTLLRTFGILAAALSFPALAHAHSGHELVMDCASGIAHPLFGWDHLVAMIGVGLLAARHDRRGRWLLPTVFVTVMTCAAALGTRGFVLPGTETMIATSVLVFGLLIAASFCLPLTASATVVGFFAVAHGLAHGAEIPANSAGLSYGVGFVLSTALLHALGLLLGHFGQLRSARFSRLAGIVSASAGVALLIA